MSPPRTIRYRCHRCLLSLPSKPLPTEREQRQRRAWGELPLLRVYGLPDGWVLITRPAGEDDWCRCVQCQREVARGAPEELGMVAR